MALPNVSRCRPGGDTPPETADYLTSGTLNELYLLAGSHPGRKDDQPYDRVMVPQVELVAVLAE